jgi:hypothetical protein
MNQIRKKGNLNFKQLWQYLESKCLAFAFGIISELVRRLPIWDLVIPEPFMDLVQGARQMPVHD